MSNKNKVAVVTGSTSGIGYGIAQKLASKGFDLAINGFGDAQKIDALKQSLQADYGTKVFYSGADVSKESEIEQMIAETYEYFGQIDVVVNNAGIQYVASTDEYPTDKWHSIIAINLSAAFFTSRAVLPTMKKQGWGRIVNIASVHGLVASVNKSAYVAAKHGIVGLTKVVALENAGTGVTCNAVCPGYVMTPLVQTQIDAYAAKHGMDNEAASEHFLAEKQPTKQFSTIGNIAGAVNYFCSEDADNITGTTLAVDGGWTAQ